MIRMTLVRLSIVCRTVAACAMAFAPACGGSSASSESKDAAPTSKESDASGAPAHESGVDDAASPADATTAEGLDGTPGDAASPADGATGDASACRAFHPDPALAAKRTACAFAAGAKVADTVDDGTAARSAITHLIVLTHENRSLDHMYGTLGAGIDGFPATYTNANPEGGTVAPFHLTTSCPPDIDHSPTSITAEWDNGKMDGFYKTDGLGSLGYYNPQDHPFYSWLVTTFATSDRYFCSMMGETGHNRRFLYGASATQTANNIFTEMDAANVSWGNYFNGAQPIYNTYTFPANLPHLHPYSAFLGDLATGSLPSVTYLDTPSDEHPPGSVHDGEGVVREVLQHAFASPLWPHLAIVFNYDEGGGFFDHVPPPSACLPSSSAADAIYDYEGFRVPLVIISPYARRGYVSHIDHSHTSTLRLIEILHDLPAITARDANSDALLDMFDFGCPDFQTPPAIGPQPPKGC
jgi:phospholipase C